jgi:hypothetical protein
VLDDNTVRAGGYTTNVQVTGVAGLPTGIKGAWLKVTFLVTNIGAFSAVLENPDYVFGATSIAGWAGVANQSITGLAYTTLSSTGAFRVVVGGGNGTNRIVYDVVAYNI